MKFSEMTYTRPDINALLARCGSARQRLSRSPLPHAHLRRMTVKNIYKLRIHPLWKPFMIFKFYSDCFKRKFFYILIYKYDCMRISHRNTCHPIFLSIHGNRFIYHFFLFRNNRHFFRTHVSIRFRRLSPGCTGASLKPTRNCGRDTCMNWVTVGSLTAFRRVP